MSYVVKVPVKVSRIEELELAFEVSSKEEAEALKERIETEGLSGLQPSFEEVVDIREEEVLDVDKPKVEIN